MGFNLKITKPRVIKSYYTSHTQCSVRFTHIAPGHWTSSFIYHFNSFFGAYSNAAITAIETNRTHCHLCHTRYSFTHEWNEAREGELPCARTQHRSNDVPTLRGEKHDISLKILYQACIEINFKFFSYLMEENKSIIPGTVTKRGFLTLLWLKDQYFHDG